MSIIEKALEKSAEQQPKLQPTNGEHIGENPESVAEGDGSVETEVKAEFYGPDVNLVPPESDVNEKDSTLVMEPEQELQSGIDSESFESRSTLDGEAECFIPKVDSLEKTQSEIKSDGRYVSLNLDLLRSKGMLLPEGGPVQLAEEFRQIKRPLLMNAFPEEANGIEKSNLVLVTSSVPGEGKTFTAINLAMSIATEREKTVLLVDADVAKPSISNVLGLKTELGLIDMLEDPSIQFSDVMIRTDVPKFSILPSGSLHRHSTELLASDKMRNLTNEMSKRYSDRIIIFDSPPLMAATQGGVLADLVGQIVMVIESDSTPQYIVKEAIGKLANCEVVGCVLNKTKKGMGLNYYAYGNYGLSSD